MEKIGKTLGLTGVGLAVIAGLGYAAIVNANNITALKAMHDYSQGNSDGTRNVSHRTFNPVSPITSGVKPFVGYWLNPMTRQLSNERPDTDVLSGIRRRY